MKVYKVKSDTGEIRAEQLMNQMARDGWRVISVNYDVEYNLFTVTFEKDV